MQQQNKNLNFPDNSLTVILNKKNSLTLTRRERGLIFIAKQYLNFISFFIICLILLISILINNNWFNSACGADKIITVSFYFPISQQQKSQIANVTDKRNLISEEDFYEWLRGFADAESNFKIKRDNRKDSVFQFYFRIELHINDRPLLEYIQNRLQIGVIYPVKLKENLVRSSWEVYSKNDLFKIIKIFDLHQLNTSKKLDYLAWKEAFLIYTENNSVKKTDLTKNILRLKNSMNRQKPSVVQNHQQKIHITPYWLLGFIEGDGSFWVSKSNLVQAFELSNTLREKPVMMAIYNYLINLIYLPLTRREGKDLNSKNKLKNSVNLRIRPSTGVNQNPMVSLKFVNMIYITKIFVPFLDKLIFLSKKGMGFRDWKMITLIKLFNNLHLTQEGKNLCILLSNRMNDNTVYNETEKLTNSINRENLDNKIDKFLANNLYSIKKIEKKKTVQIQIFDADSNPFSTPMTYEEIALFFNVSLKTVQRRLKTADYLLLEDKKYTIKRVQFK